jgi:serine/threonine protein phosphatase PrpC
LLQKQIENQPSSVDYVTLHFDRKTAFALERNPTVIEPSTKVLQNVSKAPLLTDQGAWSYVGRRASQEDGYFVHDIRGPNDRSVLLAGVFDGHAGSGASGFVQSEFPAMFSNWLNLDDGTGPLQSVLDTAWNQCCEEYRTYCQTAEECIAEYDDVEGILKAYTGFNNVTSGTTATMLALDQQSGLLTLLNCGDSRGLVIDPNGQLIFQTSDHTPQSELERLKAGVQQGLTYSVPECSLGQWIVKVGPFQYKLGRALEGSLITSFGITSLADFSVLPAEAGMIAMVATDGLWEVMDSAEVSRVLTKMKKQNMSASDAAKSLCAMAYNKASNDNISIVVVFL